MNNLKIETFENMLVVDSRLIAEDLGIKHFNFISTIQKYEQELLTFDQLMFQTGTVTNSTGAINQVRYVYLTEEQATFLMTLSRNTEQVVKCKLALVKKFSEAKKQLSKPLSPAELIIAQGQALLAIEQKQALLEARTDKLETKQTRIEQVVALEAQRTDDLTDLVHQHDHELDRIFNANGHYYTIMGYCSKIGQPIAIKKAAAAGRQATKLCKQNGLDIVPISDPRFGSVNSYPEFIIAQVV